jgi:hypothetical protein
VLGVALTKWNFPNNLAHKLYGGCTVDQEMVMVQGSPYVPTALIFIVGDCCQLIIHGKSGCIFHVYLSAFWKHIMLHLPLHPVP